MERLLLAALVLAVVAYPVYTRTRERAARSPRARSAAIVRGWIGMVVGTVLALWLPQRVPETPGSPASLLAVLALWIVGGLIALASLVVLIAALGARPGSGHVTG